MRTRVGREGARDRSFIGEEDGKVGRNEKESGEGAKREGGMKSGKEINGNRKVKQRMQKGKSRIGKVFAGKIKGEIFRRSARSVGKYREKQGKIEVRG